MHFQFGINQLQAKLAVYFNVEKWPQKIVCSLISFINKKTHRNVHTPHMERGTHTTTPFQ
jgi:hypothetical protein